MAPQRIRMSRAKGWRKPEGAIYVGRPSKWGNPFGIASCIEQGFATDRSDAHRVCAKHYRAWLLGDFAWSAGEALRRGVLAAIPTLRGHDLACWCPLDQPCHADVLLEMANVEDRPSEARGER